MLVHETAGLGNLGSKIGPPGMPVDIRNRGCKRIELPPSTIVSKGVPPEITAANRAAYEKFQKTNDKVQYEKDLAPVRKASLAWSDTQARMWKEDKAKRRQQMEAEVARLKTSGWTEEVVKSPTMGGKGSGSYTITTRYICPPARTASPVTSSAVQAVSQTSTLWDELKKIQTPQIMIQTPRTRPPIERPQPSTTAVPYLPGLIKAATGTSSAAQEGGGSSEGQGPDWKTYALVGGGVIVVGAVLYFVLR